MRARRSAGLVLCAAAAIVTAGGCSSAVDGDAAGVTHVVTETVTVTADSSAMMSPAFDPCATLEELYAEHQEQVQTTSTGALREMYVTAMSENGCEIPASPTPDAAAATTADPGATVDVCAMLEDAYQQEVDAGRVDEATEQYWTTMFDANGCQD